MIICSNCTHSNREGMLFCENCGYSITEAAIGTATVPTRRIDNDPDDSIAKATWGSARFSAGTSIIVHIRDANESITLESKKRIIFGRSDTTSTINPDVDLTAHGAIDKGVSRQHAAIEVSEETVMLLDVGSSNGTFLNGQRLLPNQPRLLRDGDEVRFGKLVAHIYFKSEREV
jgi:pSer/pThr/pTyr-binding forkhead associated (FHA) protein